MPYAAQSCQCKIMILEMGFDVLWHLKETVSSFWK